MKRIAPLKSLCIALCAVFSAVGCNTAPHSLPQDFTLETYSPVHAGGFTLRGTERSAATLLTVRNPWQGAEGVELHVLLAPREEELPDVGAIPVVRTPIRRAVCLSSSHVAMFDALDAIESVKGVSGIDYLSNPYIAAHRASGQVRDVGSDSNLDFELLAALRPDVVLLYATTGENTATTSKLRELGIPYIYIGDYMEPTPLGKAEWLMVVAELCGKRAEGQALFEGIAARYEATRAAVAADTSARRPRVMLNTPYRDTWFMPSTQSFMVRLVEDAGGAYVYPQNTSNTSVAVDLEEAYLLARSADVWLNVGGCNSLQELRAQNPRFASVPAVAQRRVYNNNRRQTPAGGSDFWESGIMRPDRVLLDLAAIMRGSDADTTYYYQRLE